MHRLILLAVITSLISSCEAEDGVDGKDGINGIDGINGEDGEDFTPAPGIFEKQE